MGPRPGPEYSIDRRNNNRGYHRSNCRWATDLQQAQNTRRTKKVSEAAEGLHYAQNLLGWSRQKLAQAAGTSMLALANYEVNGSDPRSITVHKWWRALIDAGIELSDEPPYIRLRTKPRLLRRCATLPPNSGRESKAVMKLATVLIALKLLIVCAVLASFARSWFATEAPNPATADASEERCRVLMRALDVVGYQRHRLDLVDEKDGVPTCARPDAEGCDYAVEVEVELLQADRADLREQMHKAFGPLDCGDELRFAVKYGLEAYRDARVLVAKANY